MKMNRVMIWIKAVRAPFFTGTMIPVALGAMLAWHNTDSFVWFKFWLTMFGILFIHAGTNLTNDYFDHVSGCDKANLTPTPFSGGSRVIQDGTIKAKNILRVALISISIGGIIGIYLNYLSKGNVILIIGIIGIILGFFYTARPFQFGYGSFGELAVGVGFGPLIVLGAYYVQTQILSFSVFLVSVPVGILIMLVLYINEFPDYDADKSVGKRNIVVLLGKKKAIVLYHVLLVLVYVLIIMLVALKMLPVICLIALLSLPLAIKAFLVSKKYFDKVHELLPANAATIGIHSLIGILLCAGIFIDKIF